LIFRSRIPHPATFVKRTVLLKLGGFDLSYRLAMDYDLWARLCAAGYECSYYARLIAIFAQGGLTTTQRQQGNLEAAQIRQRLRNTPLKRVAGTLYDWLKRR
jgi:GT2 family glycosyltransferase